MCRIYDKGAKYASPADFPNLVPSSPVGHAAIYLGFRGPVFAMADLGVTAESAMVTGIELLSMGEGDVIAAGSVEEASPMIERCLGPICSEIEGGGVRSEGASVILLEAEESASLRGARPLAQVSWWASWREEDGAVLARAQVPSPPAFARVVIAREDERVLLWLREAGWAAVPWQAVAPRAGEHEGAGGFAAAAAVSLVASGASPAVLIVGRAPDRGYALLLVAPDQAAPDRASPLEE